MSRPWKRGEVSPGGALDKRTESWEEILCTGIGKATLA